MEPQTHTDGYDPSNTNQYLRPSMKYFNILQFVPTSSLNINRWLSWTATRWRSGSAWRKTDWTSIGRAPTRMHRFLMYCSTSTNTSTNTTGPTGQCVLVRWDVTTYLLNSLWNYWNWIHEHTESEAEEPAYSPLTCLCDWTPCWAASSFNKDKCKTLEQLVQCWRPMWGVSR